MKTERDRSIFKEQRVVFATMEDPTHTKRLLAVWRRSCCRGVTAKRAPPPSDVYWENLHHNTFLLKFFFIALTVLFAVGVGAILFLA